MKASCTATSVQSRMRMYSRYVKRRPSTSVRFPAGLMCRRVHDNPGQAGNLACEGNSAGKCADAARRRRQRRRGARVGAYTAPGCRKSLPRRRISSMMDGRTFARRFEAPRVQGRKVLTVNFFRRSCCRVLDAFSPGTARRVESRSCCYRAANRSIREIIATAYLGQLHRENSKDYCLARNLLVRSYISQRDMIVPHASVGVHQSRKPPLT